MAPALSAFQHQTEQTRPSGDTLQTPTCFSLGRDPAAEGCPNIWGSVRRPAGACGRKMGPPAQRASAGAGLSCRLGGSPRLPARSSASPPGTVGREQVAEIQDGKIQSKTGKAWGPSSEKGPDPGLVRAWLPGLRLPDPRPRPPAQSRTPTTQALPETPQVETASGPRTAAASSLFPAGAGALCEPRGGTKAASPAGLSGPASSCRAALHVCVFPAADFGDRLGGHGVGSTRPPLNPATAPPRLTGLEQAACPL